MYHTKLLTTFN